MPRQRIIKPSFWDDKGMRKLPIPARLLYICMWNYADDYGNIVWDSHFLKSRAFVTDNVSTRKVQVYMDMLEEEDKVFTYTDGDDKYGHINSWENHQRIDKVLKTDIPKPEDCKSRSETDSKNESDPKYKYKLNKSKIEIVNSIRDIWNKLADSVPQIKSIYKIKPGSTRYRKIMTRLKDEDWHDMYIEAVERIPASGFLCGDKGWAASFDWVIKSDEAVIRILEGQYETAKPMSEADKLMADMERNGRKEMEEDGDVPF